jgi:hypothetical protein
MSVWYDGAGLGVCPLAGFIDDAVNDLLATV